MKFNGCLSKSVDVVPEQRGVAVRKFSRVIHACSFAGILISCAARSGAQMTPEQRANAIIQKMTLEEKIQQLHGISNDQHRRWVPAIERLGIPPLPMANGPAGIGPTDIVQPRATAFPSPILVAASWNRDAAHEYGDAVAGEMQKIGRTMAEAPTVNIARIPQSGRVFEGYGEDPFLSGEIGVANIEGIQGRGLLANVKHFALNNQELYRSSIDAEADERTMREIYFPAFEAAVKDAHVASVMCSYNKVNGQYACQNQYLLTDVLRKDWGFDGFVVSDFGAAHDGIEDARAGMDLEMPSGTTYDEAFMKRVLSGEIFESQIDLLLRHRYAAMIRFGLFDKPITGGRIDEKAGGAIARRLAEQGIVLLKNETNILPLKNRSVSSIAVIGPTVDTLLEGGGAASVLALHSVTPLQALCAGFGKVTVHDVPVGGAGFIDPHETIDGSVLRPVGKTSSVHGVLAEFFDNPNFSGQPKFVRVQRIPETSSEFGGPLRGLTDTFSLRWSATLTAPATGEYTFGTEVWGEMSLYIDGKLVIDQSKRVTALKPETTEIHLEAGRKYQLRAEYVSRERGLARIFWKLPDGVASPGISKAVKAARQAKVVIVFAGSWNHEEFDRASLSLPGAQDALIEAVAKANPRTIVVIQSGGPILMPWIDKVAGVVEAWFPGEEGGAAIADVLSGAVNPSGRLPISFPRSDRDVPASTVDQYPGINGVEHYSEGLNVGYRWYDSQKKEPLFPFGYGLSYTKFRFTDLAVTMEADGGAIVKATVTNVGDRSGSEVVQVYLGYPPEAGEPPAQLREFSKVQLRTGESRRIEFKLSPRAFACWSVSAHGWQILSGSYSVTVGDSSRSHALTGKIKQDARLMP